MNYFSSISSADRYANGRPDFHSKSMERIKNFLNLQFKLDNALDIACGTGLSTQALLPFANKVFGTDSSNAMLENALQKDKINYQVAKAESQPFENNTFDLITVCSGVHWFDIEMFLLECNRLLKTNGYLVIYDNFFLGQMEGNADFHFWYKEVYLKTFPAPKRNNSYSWNQSTLQPRGFMLLGEEKYTNNVSFSKAELALYFTTQSNVISAVENNQTTFEEAEKWLNNQLNQFYNKADKQCLEFGNWIKNLKKCKLMKTIDET